MLFNDHDLLHLARVPVATMAMLSITLLDHRCISMPASAASGCQANELLPSRESLPAPPALPACVAELLPTAPSMSPPASALLLLLLVLPAAAADQPPLTLRASSITHAVRSAAAPRASAACDHPCHANGAAPRSTKASTTAAPVTQLSAISRSPSPLRWRGGTSVGAGRAMHVSVCVRVNRVVALGEARARPRRSSVACPHLLGSVFVNTTRRSCRPMPRPTRSSANA
jgi:hypothetical protein